GARHRWACRHLHLARCVHVGQYGFCEQRDIANQTKTARVDGAGAWLGLRREVRTHPIVLLAGKPRRLARGGGPPQLEAHVGVVTCFGSLSSVPNQHSRIGPKATAERRACTLMTSRMAA